MPWSVLRARAHQGFRRGRYPLPRSRDLTVAFGTAWDLHDVRPSFFPVPACVIFGRRAERPKALAPRTEKWSARMLSADMAWAKAKDHIRRVDAFVREAKDAAPGTESPYDARFVQGATVVPRVLLVVEEVSAGASGVGAGRVEVASRRSRN